MSNEHSKAKIYRPTDHQPITNQPVSAEIRSNFKMFPGENLRFQCKYQDGCCNIGDKHYTTVTNTRYIARREKFVCCDCCHDRPYTDQCIYLHDIAELREEKQVCCHSNLLMRFLCAPCRCFCCCCNGPKRLQLRGNFGEHLIHIHGNDVPHFETMMAEVIAKQKVSLIQTTNEPNSVASAHDPMFPYMDENQNTRY